MGPMHFRGDVSSCVCVIVRVVSLCVPWRVSLCEFMSFESTLFSPQKNHSVWFTRNARFVCLCCIFRQNQPSTPMPFVYVFISLFLQCVGICSLLPGKPTSVYSTRAYRVCMSFFNRLENCYPLLAVSCVCVLNQNKNIEPVHSLEIRMHAIEYSSSTTSHLKFIFSAFLACSM